MAPKPLRETRHHGTHRSSTAQENFLDASQHSTSLNAANDAQTTKISIFSLVQERKGTPVADYPSAPAAKNMRCSGWKWPRWILSQTESHLKPCNKSNKEPPRIRSWHPCVIWPAEMTGTPEYLRQYWIFRNEMRAERSPRGKKCF